MHAQDRSLSRSTMPVRRFRLGEEPADDITATTSASERVEMVVALSRRMLELTGVPVPAYSRDQMPVKVVPLA